MKIGIVILATNAYFILGIRFIKRFLHYYRGTNTITFYFFSDDNPIPYLSNDINCQYYHQQHSSWVAATNSKFQNIINIQNDLKNVDYIYYFDADTNINAPFTEEWFLGTMVGGEHYGNRTFLKNGVGFDKNPKSKAYVPENTVLPRTYYYGAFFGGSTDRVIEFCNILRNNQLEDKKIPYEPGVNDESYINQYFHFNPPSLTVPTENFKFLISDKGGIGETRNTSLNIENYKKILLDNPTRIFDIQNGKIIL